MQAKNPYTYRVFSRKNNTINQLKPYIEDITQFNVKYFYENAENEYRESVFRGIQNDWVAAVLTFDGNRPIGFMNIEVLDREKDTFGVGFAFVEEEYREKGIWSTMSKEAEKEAKRSGAKLFRRDIRDDNEFLVEFLTSKDKYKEIKGSSSLEKRL